MTNRLTNVSTEVSAGPLYVPPTYLDQVQEVKKATAQICFASGNIFTIISIHIIGWLSSSEPDPSILPLDLWTSASIGRIAFTAALKLNEDLAKVDGSSKIPVDDLNAKNVGGWTPLMYAAYLGHAHLVRELLAAGCRFQH